QENGPPSSANPAAAASTDAARAATRPPDSANSLVMLVPAILAMLMPAGFALLFAGMTRAKNSAHTLAIVLLMAPISGLAFFVFGFAIGWGNASHGALPAGFARLVHELPSGAMDRGIGIGSDPNQREDFAYGLAGTKGFCLSGIDDPTLSAVFLLTMTL